MKNNNKNNIVIPAEEPVLQVYEGTVMHMRSYPKRHRFSYPLCMFYTNLSNLQKTPLLWGHNRMGLFRFNDSDFLPIKKSGLTSKNKTSLCLKEKVILELKKHNNNIAKKVHAVYLLAHHRMWGYLFNPASFYFCFTENGKPLAALTEVTNTFKERKVYYVPFNKIGNGAIKFAAQHIKHFYISPFSPLNTVLQFNFRKPGKTIHLHVNELFSKKVSNKNSNSKQKKNTVQQTTNKPFLYALFRGRLKSCDSNLQLLKIAILHPLNSVKVIGLIHMQAFFLWIKKIPFYKKNEQKEL